MFMAKVPFLHKTPQMRNPIRQTIHTDLPYEKKIIYSQLLTSYSLQLQIPEIRLKPPIQTTPFIFKK